MKKNLVSALAFSGILAFSSTLAFGQDGNFTPKFAKPPEKGAKKRITVVIPLGDAPLNVSPPAKNTHRDAEQAHFEWFWTTIQAKERDTVLASDLDSAIAYLKSHDQGAPMIPPVSAAMNMVTQWNGQLLLAGAQHGVSPAFLAAVMWVESRGQQDAQSAAGAQGLMQLMPATAQRFGVVDSFDPSANVQAGAAYLRWLLNEFGGDPILALAGYNAGENAVKSAGGVPNYPETRGYVPKVLAAYSVVRGLCKTPPVLVTDGCIFPRPTGN